MTVIKSSVFHVLEKFPEQCEDIKRLFKESLEFQTMCNDYCQCAEALQYWKQSDDKHAPARKQEYAVLLQDLVDEIRMCLNIPV